MNKKTLEQITEIESNTNKELQRLAEIEGTTTGEIIRYMDGRRFKVYKAECSDGTKVCTLFFKKEYKESVKWGGYSSVCWTYERGYE
jgi:tRNA A58 N-methylase Trm61